MVRPAEIIRHVVGKTEIGLPHLDREQTVAAAKSFVTEVKNKVPDAGVDKETFFSWVDRQDYFAKPSMAANIHRQHNTGHVASVFGEAMFLKPYVETRYHVRPLSSTVVAASTLSHDFFREHETVGSIGKQVYRLHGAKMAREVRQGKQFPDSMYPEIHPEEREAIAVSIENHDVDYRKPRDRQPEDELLAIVDRADLARIVYGVGGWAKAGQVLGKTPIGNPFEHRMVSYESHFFPGLLEAMLPLSKAMVYLRAEYMKKGLDQKQAVWHAMQELGMTKED